MAINLPPRGDELRRDGHYFSTLKVSSQSIPDMTVHVSPGAFWLNGSTFVETVGGKSPRINAPIKDSKWCLVYINQSGYIRIEDGVASSRPNPPKCPANGFPLAFIYVSKSETQITPDKIFDVRGVFNTTASHHVNLEGREERNAHPIDAITGLQDALDNALSMSDITTLLNDKADASGTTSNEFKLNKDQMGAPTTTVSFLVERGTQPDVGIRWNEGIGHWEYTDTGEVWISLGNVSFSPATQDSLGGIIIGEGLTITSNGVLGVSSQTDFNFTEEHKNKVDAIPENIGLMINNKVDREFGKGLSSNDFTNSDKTRVNIVPLNLLDVLNTKVDRATGKQLSTEDYTTYEKQKVSNMPADTNAMFDTKVDKITGKQLSTEDYTSYEKQKLSKVPIEIDLILMSKVDKVPGKWLSTNDYTTVDMNKVANLPSNAIDELADKATHSEVDTKIQQVIGAAPAVLDTLEELATALADDQNFAATITTALSNKVDKIAGKYLTDNNYPDEDRSKVVHLPEDTAADLLTKVDKISGMGLSTNNYTNEDKSKVNNLSADINVNLSTKVDKEDGKVLSSNDYTNDDKLKVTNLPTDSIDEFNKKVDKITGKQLSTEDYTTEDKLKVLNLSDDINVNLSTKVDKEDGKVLSSNDYTNDDKLKVTNLPTDVTSILNTKVTMADIDTKITELVGVAPAALDTLGELSLALGDDANFAATITTALSNKVDKDGTKQLSTEDYTLIDKNKVSNIPSDTNSILLNKVDKESGKGLSKNDFTDADVIKVSNLPVDTNTILLNKVDKEDGLGLSANNYTTVEQTKVSNLPADTNAILLNKVDKEDGKGLSVNDYTTVEQTKVSNLPDNTNSELNAKQNKLFVSSESTGTGVEQILGHTLGVIPEALFITITDTTVLTDGKYSVVEGVHTSTALYVTITTGVKFKVMAIS